MSQAYLPPTGHLPGLKNYLASCIRPLLLSVSLAVFSFNLAMQCVLETFAACLETLTVSTVLWRATILYSLWAAAYDTSKRLPFRADIIFNIIPTGNFIQV